MTEELKFAATEGGAQAWQKVIKRNAKGTALTATDVGWLRPGDSRVNLLSSLPANDKVAFYKVKVLSEGKFAAVIRGDADLRIQVMDSHQRVLIDSKSGMGVASENFKAMTDNEFSLKQGDYYVKLTRADGVSLSEKVNYALQMQVGETGYKHDYLTREVAPTAQERFEALLTPDGAAPTSTASSFLSSFAGTSSGGLMNPPRVGKILSVLA